MIKIKDTLINNRVHLIRFGVSVDEVNDIIEEFEDITGKRLSNDDLNVVLSYFETTRFRDLLIENNINYIGPLHFKYLNDVVYGTQLLGICYGIDYDSDYNLELPSQVNQDINSQIDDLIENKNIAFDYLLLNNGLYYEKADTIIKPYGKIDYEIRYLEKGKVFNVIKNQHFDMLEDDDIDASILIGAKIGDFVIIDNSDVTIGALIQNVTNRIPFNEDMYDYDIVFPILKKLGFSTFNELRTKYYEEYSLNCARDLYFNDIITSIANNCHHEVTEDEIDFYNEFGSVPFNDELKVDELEEKKEVVKKILTYHYVMEKYCDIEDVDLLNEDPTITEVITDTISNLERNYNQNKIAIIDYMKSNNVKNIIKKYK